MIFKTQNKQNKERILRAEKEKGQGIYKGKPIRITPDFSMETMKARRSQKDVPMKIQEAYRTPNRLEKKSLLAT